jgi:hypothetical protein
MVALRWIGPSTSRSKSMRHEELLTTFHVSELCVEQDFFCATMSRLLHLIPPCLKVQGGCTRSRRLPQAATTLRWCKRAGRYVRDGPRVHCRRLWALSGDVVALSNGMPCTPAGALWARRPTPPVASAVMRHLQFHPSPEATMFTNA